MSSCSRLLSILLFSLATISTLPAEEPTYRYNVTCNDEHEFVWFRVAKVGTSTIIHLLRNQLGVNVTRASSGPYSSEKYRGYFKFAFVRNPWDRVVSLYFNKVAPGTYCEGTQSLTFEQFVDWLAQQDLTKIDAHAKLQALLIPVDELDFIGRFETFSKDVQYVLGRLGLSKVSIPKHNPSSHAHYSRYYDDRTRELVRQLYREDIERFGYTFEVR